MPSDRPMVTVVLTSGRPGGVDVSLLGLSRQTFTDFEVVFVDGLYHKRHGAVLDFAKSVGLKAPLYHVPHHRSPDNDLWGVPSAGFNTGFMLAAGHYVIMLLDYAYAPPGWIEEHLKCHRAGRRMVFGPHIYTASPAPVTREGQAIRLFDYEAPTPPTPEEVLAQRRLFDETAVSVYVNPYQEDVKTLPKYEQNDCKLGILPGPCSGEYMHTKNDSFPLDAVFEINGMDEVYDRGRGPGDSDFGRRFEVAGVSGFLNHDAAVFCANPRAYLPNMNVTIPLKRRLAPPYHDRFCYEEGRAIYNLAAHEKTKRSSNPYDLKERRDKIWNWRELSLNPQPVIPDIRISDKEWFRDR